MANKFVIQHWAAWAPGLEDQSAWRSWLSQPTAVSAEGVPALPEVPAMMRRRIERLGRAALQVAFHAQGDVPACPVVFASRYGDLSSSIKLLRTLAEGEALSPTAFSMSVHNAFGALFSITRGDTGPYSAIAAGAETVASAFVEAQGLLADGAPAVLIVYYDEMPPDVFAEYADEQIFPHAWSCLVRASVGQGISLQSGVAHAQHARTPHNLPADLAILQFLIGDSSRHHHVVGEREWCWARHA